MNKKDLEKLKEKMIENKEIDNEELFDLFVDYSKLKGVEIDEDFIDYFENLKSFEFNLNKYNKNLK